MRFVTGLERSLERAAEFLHPSGSGVDGRGLAPWAESARQHGLLGATAANPTHQGGSDAANCSAELERELTMRGGLVQEQWNIRGPGLLAAIGRQPGIVTPSQPIEIQLVLPLVGGAAGLNGRGQAWLEALLHDVSPQFSETLRVGWLVALQLTGDQAGAARLLFDAATEVDWLTASPETLNELRNWLGIEEPAKPLSPPLRRGSHE